MSIFSLGNLGKKLPVKTYPALHVREPRGRSRPCPDDEDCGQVASGSCARHQAGGKVSWDPISGNVTEAKEQGVLSKEESPAFCPRKQHG